MLWYIAFGIVVLVLARNAMADSEDKMGFLQFVGIFVLFSILLSVVGLGG